jgi:hypothetical protein
VSLFGHSSGAHFASLIALTDASVSQDCLAEVDTSVPDELVLFEGDWLLLALPVYEPLIVEDRAVWEALTPWPHLADAPRLPITIFDSGDPRLAIHAPERIDPMLVVRDPDGVHRDALDRARAFDDEQLTETEVQQLLADELSNLGYAVTFVSLPDSSHEQLSKAALVMLSEALAASAAAPSTK